MKGSPSKVIANLLDPGVIAVIRSNDGSHVLPACEALLAGGIRALEITLTTPDALDSIQEAIRRFGKKASVGAGTVTGATQAVAAIDAGAEFIVSPVMKPEVAVIARSAGRIVMLGAFTPTEAQAAHEAGADFVKLFPGEIIGPGFIKSILGPLPHLKLVPTGGVDLGTLPAFFAAGAAAVGAGSSLVSEKTMRTGDWAELTRLAREFTALARRCGAPRLSSRE